MEVYEFHYRSGQAFSVDLVEKSSAIKEEESKMLITRHIHEYVSEINSL